MPKLAQTVLVNGMIENQRYKAVLQADVPAPSAEAADTVQGETPSMPEEPLEHRHRITLDDVMGHPLVQPFRHTLLHRPEQ